MKVSTVFVSLVAISISALANGQSSIIGQGRHLAQDDADDFALAHQLAVGAKYLVEGNRGIRRLSSPLDKTEVMIKNVDCHACMEAPQALSPATRHLRSADALRELIGGRVFVTALNCDTNDPYQVWNLLSLEPTGTWYQFESNETGECMVVDGICHPDGTLYDIRMDQCDVNNPKSFWAFTGVGEIVSFICMHSNWESETRMHSTPDIFLEAECNNRGGKDYLDLSSHSSESEDQAQNYWNMYPKSFGALVSPPP